MGANILLSVVAALFAVARPLLTQRFFEAVLIKILLWAGSKLVPLTTNTLDDDLYGEIKNRLAPPVVLPAGDNSVSDADIQNAYDRKDFFEYARLINLRAGVKQ